MKIAQIAPLYESVPPKFYGGTERIVSYLTEELVRLGHEVTLFASGDSETSAKLEAVTPRSLRLDENCVDRTAHHVLMIEKLFKDTSAFDMLHFHIDYLHLPLATRQKTPHLSTFHGRLDISDLVPLYKEYRDAPFSSISHAQRKPLSWLNWQATVYHGLPANLYKLQVKQGEYLAFIGRISPEKGLDRAIEISKKAEMPLRIAAKIGKADVDYFENVIKPLLDPTFVEYVGEIDESDKQEFLGNAYALVFPIDWPEPFGLVMIEAMACGTPVIAFRSGSVPEVMSEGTGFVVTNIDEAVRAVQDLADFDRARCRKIFEERFLSSRMAHDYLKIYGRLIENAKQKKAS